MAFLVTYKMNRKYGTGSMKTGHEGDEAREAKKKKGYREILPSRLFSLVRIDARQREVTWGRSFTLA